MRTCLLSLIVALGCGQHSRTPAATAFTAPNGDFSIAFPSSPQIETTPLAGGAEGQTYSLTQGSDAYLVMCAPLAQNLGSIEQLLNEGRDAVLRESQGTLLTEKSIEVQGCPGRDFVMQLPQGRQRIHVIVGKSKSFQLIAGGPDGDETSPAAEAFFSSFKMLK
jgi:hypothetical protein